MANGIKIILKPLREGESGRISLEHDIAFLREQIKASVYADREGKPGANQRPYGERFDVEVEVVSWTDQHPTT